ncbi:MAG: S-layer homology domain-containing protein, partial [Clostridia bacterium]|nr:S-layer homology domain-containing protein [Clostridia bacterium]
EIEDKATVTFNVTPADAVVKVEKDGVEFGGTDNAYDLLGGTYNYTVSKDGYYTVSGSFTVAGEDLPVNVTLTKIAYYTITYTDGVEDAEIFADQSFTVAENTATPAFEGTIAREGYTFKGWTPAVAATVTADATYVAVFEKIPEEPKDPVFEDVSADAYYADAVVWAAKNKVTTGVEEGVFAPEAMCTRAQVVTFLWRAAGSPKASAETEVSFTDIEEISYYYDAVVWAVENGITNGVSATEFAPDAICTRAQVATFLWRAAGEPKVEAEMPFDDVEEGAYYYDAVLWAMENGITNGVSATAFAPEADCTRAQAVTLVYRAV